MRDLDDQSPQSKVTLGDLCDLVTVQVAPEDVPGAVYIGLEHVPSGRLRTTAHGAASDVSSAKTAFESGDVLLSKLRPYLDKAVLADADGICTTELLVLRAKPGVDPRFLVTVVHRPDFVRHAMAGVTGAQHPRTSWHHVSRFELPRVPHAEQLKIARFLWLLHDLLEATARALGLARRLKRDAVPLLFARGLDDGEPTVTSLGLTPAGWRVARLGAVSKIGNGSTPKKSVPEYWDGGTFPWLTSAKVYDREIDQADQFVTDEALDRCHLPIVSPGAVLMAITGQGKTLGNVAVLEMEATVSQHVAYIQPADESVNPYFLRAYLETRYEHLRQVGSGGGSTKGAITCGYLRELQVPLPDVAVQRDVVRVTDALDFAITVHERKLRLLERLLQALLTDLTNDGAARLQPFADPYDGITGTVEAAS